MRRLFITVFFFIPLTIWAQPSPVQTLPPAKAPTAGTVCPKGYPSDVGVIGSSDRFSCVDSDGDGTFTWVRLPGPGPTGAASQVPVPAGILIAPAGVATFTRIGSLAPALRGGMIDLNGDTLPESTWYIDRDGDGWYTPGGDLLLGTDDLESDRAECNVGNGVAYPWQIGNKAVTGTWPEGSQPPIQSDPTNWANGAGQRPGLCYCWNTSPALGDSCGVAAAISNSLATPLKCSYLAAKLILFQSTVCNYGGDFAREFHRLFVGGLATGAAHDLARLRNAVGFWYAPRDDVDGDGTAGDDDGDADWWVVTAADSSADGTAGDPSCLQLADGNGDGYLDCNGDGTVDADVQDQWYGSNGYTAVNTGVRAYTYGGTTRWTCFDLAIAHERNVFRFWVNGRLVASLVDHIPSAAQPLCFWGAIDDATTAGSRAVYAIDRVRYLGRP